MPRDFLQLASGIVTVYSFIIIFRILITWFRGFDTGGVGRFLSAIADPYLNLFRGIRFLHMGTLDFSPVLGIMLLQVLASILRYLALTGVISPLVILAAVALAIWQTVFSILVFFGILAVVRFAGILFMRGPAPGFFFVLDSILEPFTLIVRKCLPGGRNIPYPQTLAITIVFITLVCLLGIFFVEPSLYVLLGWSFAPKAGV